MAKKVKKERNKSKIEKREDYSLAELKKKLKHQRDALKKIIKTYSK